MVVREPAGAIQPTETISNRGPDVIITWPERDITLPQPPGQGYRRLLAQRDPDDSIR